MTNPATTEQIATWNAQGRAFIAELNSLITDMNEGRDTPKEWPEEPRGEDAAWAIIAAVEAGGRAASWAEDAPIADRAHEPLVPLFDGRCQNLRCVVILGQDEFLVCPGTAWQPGTSLHLKGGSISERPEILGASASRSHDLLLIATEQGFSVSTGLDAPALRRFAWPESVAPLALDQLYLAEDGLTIAFANSEHAVWLGQWVDGGALWTCAYPTPAFMEEIRGEDEDDDEAEDEAEDGDDMPWSDSMLHCALSPDGRFIAYGSQCFGHFLDVIEGPGVVRRWADIGRSSEYPHDACFSDDSAYAAFNSCHFYRGATVGVRVDAVEGAETEEYGEDPLVTDLDDRLRVYASTWLPQVGDTGHGGFALAGASYLDVPAPDGTMLATLYFGSSASSIDYCPKTGQLAVASYSGFLHLYDPRRAAAPGSVIGYKPFHERYRWVIWQDRAPFRW